MGFYQLKKYLDKNSDESARLKIVEKSEILKKSLLVMQSHPQFTLLVLKILTLMLVTPIAKIVSQIDS